MNIFTAGVIMHGRVKLSTHHGREDDALMCFSSTASFASSGILLGLGVASVKNIRDRSQIIFAATPIAFAIQQFSEGILWKCLSGSREMSCAEVSSYVFVSFGQIFWPFWMPLSVFMMEEDKKRKNILRYLLALGVFMSLILFYLSMTHDLSAEIVSHHIRYNFGYPEIVDLVRFSYLIPTILPCFVSSNRHVNGYGALLLVSFFLTIMIAQYFVFSVWCFFAAGASAYIYYVMSWRLTDQMNPSYQK